MKESLTVAGSDLRSGLNLKGAARKGRKRRPTILAGQNNGDFTGENRDNGDAERWPGIGQDMGPEQEGI
jgi:hypothetical protein